MFKFKYLIILIVIYSTQLMSESDINIIKKTTINEEEFSLTKSFAIHPDLKEINKALNEKNYILLTQLIQELSLKIKIEQQAQIEQIFPTTIGNYKTNEKKITEFDINTPSYGVLLTKSYKNNKSNNEFNINIIYSDPSIEEYINIINNPSLIEEIENTKIITIQNQFNSIEKISLNEEFYEYNIIINNNTLLNIIFSDLKNKDIIQSFFKSVDLSKIKTILK